MKAWQVSHIIRLHLVFCMTFVLGCSRGAFMESPSQQLLAQRFGLSTHIPTGSAPDKSQAREFELFMNRNAGVRLLRTDFLWPEIEKTQGKFSFDAYDQMVDEAWLFDQEFIGLLTYAPDWARSVPGDDSSIDPEDFAFFVFETVTHFKGRIGKWEIWNEPNWIYWKGGPDPVAYGALLKAAYRAAKKADPSCTVAFGGISSDPLTYKKTWGFFEEVYKAHPDIGSFYDVMAIHPYTYFQFKSPEEETEQGNIVQMIKNAREIMSRHGDGKKPMWITELGWPAGPGEPVYYYPPNMTYNEQASWLVRSFVLSISEGIQALCWYDFIDGDGSAIPSSENYFGLVKYDRTPKDSYQAFNTMTRILGPLHYESDLRGALGLKGDEYGFLFQSASGKTRVFVLWNAGKGLTTTVELSLSRSARQIDMLGRETNLLPQGGRVAVDISESPVYVIDT